MLRHQHRIPDFLDHDDIRPEGVDDHVVFFLSHGSELQPDRQESFIEFTLAEILPFFRVLVSANQIHIPLRYAGRRHLGQFNGNFVFGHKSDIHHKRIQASDAGVAEDTG